MLTGTVLVACLAPPAEPAEIPTAPTEIEAVDLEPAAPVPPEPEPEPSEPEPSEPEPSEDDFEDDFEDDDEFLDDDFLDDYDPLVDSPEAVDARRWRNGGIIALSAGAGLGIGAIVLASVDSCTPLAGNNCFGDSKRRSVATMAVPASVLLAAGATLLTVGLVKRARLKASVASDGDSALVFLSGRF